MILLFITSILSNQQQDFYTFAFVLPQRLQLITISLHPSAIKGIQKQRRPVKKYKQTDQEIAAHPGDNETVFDPIALQTGQAELIC